MRCGENQIALRAMTLSQAGRGTCCVAGSKLTFPLWVFGATRQGIPVQVNVMGTLLFTFGILVVAGQLVATRMRARGDERRLAEDKARLAAVDTS